MKIKVNISNRDEILGAVVRMLAAHVSGSQVSRLVPPSHRFGFLLERWA
jgi:hypothetical protein